ncbi:MAG: GIY-YIG nuclease family protein [Verrucomicrobiota bacterium]|jgi:putative endonuclease
MFWTYILENLDGKFYIGHTEDLTRRIQIHNDPNEPGTRFTPKNGPWNLVWSEEHPTRACAMARERQIKRMKSAKWIREVLLSG